MLYISKLCVNACYTRKKSNLTNWAPNWKRDTELYIERDNFLFMVHKLDLQTLHKYRFHSYQKKTKRGVLCRSLW